MDQKNTFVMGVRKFSLSTRWLFLGEGIERKSRVKNILIIGGGFFGLNLASHLAGAGHKVCVVEKDNDFMQRASYANQARVHNGYHYPRSILTGLRSRVSFPRFCQEFADCIDTSFKKYYMIPKLLSKVSPKQFELFCQRIGAPCEPAPYEIKKLANSQLIEAVYATVEYAFDSNKLKNVMLERLADQKVTLLNNCEVTTITQGKNRLSAATMCSLKNTPGDDIKADHIFNCTYAMINNINQHSGLATIPLKHEFTEMCLVEVPDELKNMGITVMDGPFFSLMPFPARRLHTLSHVRYTPHYEWTDRESAEYINAHQQFSDSAKETVFKKMQQDARRYIPMLGECKYRESIWEVKTILPRSENNDSRPMLFNPNHGIPNYHCIMGGKIDNVYDVHDAIDASGLLDE